MSNGKGGIPRIVIAATSSGSGKTVVTCALLQYLAGKGMRPVSYKCGPDYIDPMFHKKVIGIPSRNLDLFFQKEKELVRSFAASFREEQGEVAVIEGVMGLYDGLGGCSQEASTYHVARCLKAPIVLVVNARGMGRSLLALLSGFLKYDTEHLIRGVILNQTSKGFCEKIGPIIEQELSLRVLGYLPREEALGIESRHLGLQLPEEVEKLRDRLNCAAALLQDCVDVRAIRTLAEEARGMLLEEDVRIPTEGSIHMHAKGIIRERASCEEECEPEGACQDLWTLAVAKDEAFCFFYEENLKMLEQAGLRIVFFSPLHDKALPEGACGLLLPGGYPELFAEQLSANLEMRLAIREAVSSGMPSVAECGGFMYLHEQLEDEDGTSYPLVGCVEGSVRRQKRLVRFGYVEIAESCPFFLGEGTTIRGHEFHYYDSENNGKDCTATKALGEREWKCIHDGKAHWWGFPHLYYPSNPGFVEHFAEAVERYGKQHGRGV